MPRLWAETKHTVHKRNIIAHAQRRRAAAATRALFDKQTSDRKRSTRRVQLGCKQHTRARVQAAPLGRPMVILRYLVFSHRSPRRSSLQCKGKSPKPPFLCIHLRLSTSSVRSAWDDLRRRRRASLRRRRRARPGLAPPLEPLGPRACTCLVASWPGVQGSCALTPMRIHLRCRSSKRACSTSIRAV